MPPVRVNSLVRLMVLAKLLENPSHGYALIQMASKQLGKNVSAGEMYPFLQQLKRQKLVLGKGKGSREKTVFMLSAEGKKVARSWLNKMDSIADTIIQQKVRQCAHCDCEIYHGGFEKRIHGKRMLFCCEHCAKAMRSHAR